MTQRKKPNKEQRAKRRKDHADTFTQGFNMGYGLGYAEGKKAALEAFSSGYRATIESKVKIQ